MVDTNNIKKVIWRGQGHESYALCPNCKKVVAEDQDYPKPTKCNNCNQELDFDD